MIDLERIVEPALMWLWNAPPREDEIRRQLDAFLDRGVRAVYIHPMPSDFRPHDFHGGMDIEYLSDGFFDWIVFAAEEIRRRDMILWLYDEGGWPSGVAGGRVVADNPEFGAWTLTRADGVIAPRQMLDSVNYPDLMNAEATACFIRHTHEQYRKAVGHFFGTTIPGIFTDEPRLLGRVGTDAIPWSPRLPEAFEREHGIALDDVLDHLFESGPEHVAAQRRYLKTVSRLIVENYYAPLRRWCNDHGLLFEGHHTGEDDFARHGVHFGDFLEQARQYDIPGIDAIWRQIFPGQDGGNYVSLASSSAWVQKRRIALSESFAVYGAGLTLEQMRWIAAFQLVRGVNKFAFMAALFSVAGARRICTCHDIGPHDPRWLHFDLFIEFVRRAAKFTISGQPRPTVGVLYRMELVDPNRADVFTAEHEALCDRILDGLNTLMFVAPGESGRGGLRALAVHTDAPLSEAEQGAIASMGIDLLPFETDWDPARYSLLAPLDCPPGVRVLPLETEQGLNLLFFNQTERQVSVEFHSEVELAEFVLDDELAAAIHPPQRRGDRVTLRLLPWQMRALVPGRCPSPPWRVLDNPFPLEHGWTVRETERVVIGRTIRREPILQDRRPTGLTDYACVEPEFSGTLEYECNFDWRRRNDERVILDLGRVCDAAAVEVNGVRIGRRAWRPFWFDVTGALAEGANTVHVWVTNTLANQWLRPALRERDNAHRPNPYRRRVQPFLEESRCAGLLGPVTLCRYRPPT